MQLLTVVFLNHVISMIFIVVPNWSLSRLSMHNILELLPITLCVSIFKLSRS